MSEKHDVQALSYKILSKLGHNSELNNFAHDITHNTRVRTVKRT